MCQIMVQSVWICVLLLLTGFDLSSGQNISCSIPANESYYQVTPAEWSRFQLQYGLYTSAGSFSVLANVFIFITILRFKELRKKYFILLLLAAADLNLGLAFATCGVHRMHMIANGVHKVITSVELITMNNKCEYA